MKKEQFNVPDRIQKMLTKKSIRDKMKPSCFLVPKEKKYPICNPLTGKLDCSLIRAALIRASGFNKDSKKYPDIAKKAKQLFDKHCAKKESITLETIYTSLLIEFVYKYGNVIKEWNENIAHLFAKYCATQLPRNL